MQSSGLQRRRARPAAAATPPEPGPAAGRLPPWPGRLLGPDATAGPAALRCGGHRACLGASRNWVQIACQAPTFAKAQLREADPRNEKRGPEPQPSFQLENDGRPKGAPRGNRCSSLKKFTIPPRARRRLPATRSVRVRIANVAKNHEKRNRQNRQGE